MPAGYGIEYWAIWAEEYVALANDPDVKNPNMEMAQRHNMDPLSLGTIVTRLRNRHGLLTPFTSHREPPQLTEKAMEILGIEKPKESLVKFTVEIEAGSKVRALAQVWDVVQQLEHWDDRRGEPFKFDQGRIKDMYQE
jgi:hypothetical protein